MGLSEFFRAEKFDVVQSHDFNAMLLCRFAGFVADVPVRVSRVVGLVQFEAPLPRALDRWTCRLDTLFLGVRYTLETYRRAGIGEDRLLWMPSGVDTRTYRSEGPRAGLRARFGYPERCPLIGLVGHFYPLLSNSPWLPASLGGRCPKGHVDFLRAARSIADRRPDVRFVMIGGPFGDSGVRHLEAVKNLRRDLDLEERVAIFHETGDMASNLRDLDVVVQPSLTENLPRTVMEALAVECPVVASRIGGIVDVIEDGVTGRLVNPARPEELAEAVLATLDDLPGAAAMAASGRRRIEATADVHRLVDEVANRYRDQLTKRTKRSDGFRPGVMRRRGFLLKAALWLLKARIQWSLRQFEYPARTFGEVIGNGLLAVDFPSWGPVVFGMAGYVRMAGSRFGFLESDGSLRLRPATPMGR